jgi:sortase A
MKRKLARTSGILFGVIGAAMLGSVLFPFVTYQIKSSSDFQEYLSPVPDVSPVDYTKPATWFPGSDGPAVSNLVKYYNVTIPRLGIQGAVVSVGGEDLADSLIQYPGTALPGKIGNAVVFGHSVLPAFFDAKDYLTIFSTLPTMKKKDEVKIDYDGITYMYRVEDMYEVDPSNLEVLSQNADASYISLITCVPPGDPRRPRRLVVRAKLVPPSERTLSYDNTSF